jgi:hypothetical protein
VKTVLISRKGRKDLGAKHAKNLEGDMFERPSPSS